LILRQEDLPMYDSAPEEYSDHLQSVGREMLNGSLDKVGAVIRLVRLGWSHEEAHAAVSEIAEQVDTTNKLIRDAARVLDDSPSGQARASGRLREAGFTGEYADQLVQNWQEHRHQSADHQRDMIIAIRHGRLQRNQAVEHLTSQGLDAMHANIKVDIATDSSTHWANEWFKLTIIVALAAVINCVAIGLSLMNNVFDLIGIALVALLACTCVAFYYTWQNQRFWQDWTLLHQAQRDCPRSCSPIVMMAESKGRRAAIMTSMEWGLSRLAASEMVREQGNQHADIYKSWIYMGIAILTVSLVGSIFVAIYEPEHLVLITILETVMSIMSGFMIYKGLIGRAAFRKQ
jgi:hypothetical protein